MWYLSELVFKSYLPKELKEGMLFMSIFNQGTVKEFVLLWVVLIVPIREELPLSS